MTYRWQYEDEYLQLISDYTRAQSTGDLPVCEQLRSRLEKLNAMMWLLKTQVFPELLPYKTVLEALYHTALRLNLSFPDLTDPHNHGGDGQFIFGIADQQRTVHIWPLEDRGYYSVELFDYVDEQQYCYKGHTTLLEEATIALNQWFIVRCSITILHDVCP